jgi:hypothetical protein
LTLAVLSFIKSKNADNTDVERSQTTRNKPNAFRDPLVWATLAIAAATVTLTVVGLLQWRTLEKSDQTLRAGQRAFVFVRQIPTNWTAAQTRNGTVVRDIPIEWENNGNSQTKDLIVEINCPRPQWFVSADPMTISDGYYGKSARLLGPKQSVLGGTCSYTAEQLKSVQRDRMHLYVTARATYSDIFNEKHITEYCGEIVDIVGNFDDLSVIPKNTTQICGRNCADKECDKKQ